MRVALLAGGLGTRLAEETEITPKPMVEIGGRPILWHIMKRYAAHGLQRVRDRASATRARRSSEYFLDYAALQPRLHRRARRPGVDPRRTAPHATDWRVHLVDTGLDTMTGGRVKRARATTSPARRSC